MNVIKQVLSPDEIHTLGECLAAATFIDGSATVAVALKQRKQNLQLDRTAADPEETTAIDSLIEAALIRHPVFSSLAIPRKFVAPIFSRYEPGMHYGMHVDAALMGQNYSVRTDLALTLFLSEPSDYDGGELLIESPAGPIKIKLAAGDAVLYPAVALHQVLPVTRGKRLAAITWIQSAVRDLADRQMLHDLNTLAYILHESSPESPASLLAAKSYHNLLRKLADP